jgi:hypothetical protein
MKQYVNTCIKLPGSAYTLDFFGVYKTADKLIVITESKPIPGVMGTAAIAVWPTRKAITVEVSKKLPVEYYHLGGGEFSEPIISIQTRDLKNITQNAISLPFESCSYAAAAFNQQGFFTKAALAAGVVLTAAAVYRLF